MTRTPTIPAGIGQLAKPCWELAYANTGHPYEVGEGLPHYETREKAQAEADAAYDNYPELGELVATQHDTGCWTATAACGFRLDEQVMEMHHETAEAALQAAKDCDWTLAEDGTLRCSTDCDDCAGAA